jgi:hypothetical protein
VITLTLDYVLTGQRRGYTLSPADAVPSDIYRAIWRGALPRGQGWDAPAFIGARALKSFPIDARTAVMSAVTISDRRDELGRGGIKQALIHYGTHDEIQGALRARLEALPAPVVHRAEAALASRAWALLFKRHWEQTRGLKPQTVLVFPYDPVRWLFIEACLLLLATRATLLTNLIELSPTVNPFADKLLSFTTLALDPRDEARLVAVPTGAPALAGVPHIDLSSAQGVPL